MPEISAKLVKELRERSGAGMMACKEALRETGGDLDKAFDLLRQKGQASVAKRAGRAADQGVIESYIHFNNTVGTLVELNCESDFVANTSEFRQLARDIALHVASPLAPSYVSRNEIPESVLASERHIYEIQAKEMGKPDTVTANIVEGKLKAFFEETVLVEQPFVKDDSRTIQQLLEEVGAKVGEKVVVRRFVRFRLGEQTE